MLIGYSFWGFLGPGITNTPDGGRSHRRTLIDGLGHRGNDLVFLQADRDRLEAGQPIDGPFHWTDGLPDIDALFLEWRWPIEGRNTTPCGTRGHTCDLHRQQELLDRYTATGVPTIVWDKDLQLPAGDPVRTRPNVRVCEAALHPSPGASTVLFPVDDGVLDSIDAAALIAGDRDLELCYIGNQYGRDDAFGDLFAPAAETLRHAVAGKWASPQARWGHVNFVGRIPFTEVEDLYRRSVATVCLLPQRYRQVGQMTQRLFEAILAGCLPLVPTNVAGHDRFVPSELLVTDADAIVDTARSLASIAGTDQHLELLRACLQRLDLFRASAQLDVLDEVLAQLVDRSGREAPPATGGRTY